MTPTKSITPTFKPRKDFSMLDDIKAGESILLPMDYYTSLSQCLNLRQRRDNKKFARRLDGGKVRVWRLA